MNWLLVGSAWLSMLAATPAWSAPKGIDSVSKKPSEKNFVSIKVQSGFNNHQDSPDYSRHIIRKDNRTYNDNRQYNITKYYIVNPVTKTVIIKQPNGIKIGLAIVPVGPQQTSSPLDIPFMITNSGSSTLYNFKATASLNYFGRGSNGGETLIIDNKMSGDPYWTLAHRDLRPDEHFPLHISSLAGTENQNATAEVEIAADFSLTHNGPIKTSRYTFSLEMTPFGEWNWIKTTIKFDHFNETDHGRSLTEP